MNLSGSPFDFLVAFFAGALASFTPCVYPLVPISAGYIVGNARNSKLRALFLSLFYVSGVALTYSVLGIIAVVSGGIFGQFSTTPAAGLISGTVIFIFGLSMLDLFQINLRPAWKPPVYSRATFAGAFVLGLVSGLLVSPCLTPVLGSILAYLTTTKSVFYGAFLLLSFSYGLGLIFILTGTFGSQLAALPKPGKWMLTVKRFCAAVMLCAGLYFIITAIRRF